MYSSEFKILQEFFIKFDKNVILRVAHIRHYIFNGLGVVLISN